MVGDSPDRRVEILSDHDALHATWSRFGPGRDGADRHVHHRHTDVFYVLEGELTVKLGSGGEEVAAPAGTLALLPPLVVHGFRNGSAADVTYLNLHAPGRGFAEFMRALHAGRSLAYDQHPPPAEGARPASEAVFAGGPPPDGGADGVELLAEAEEVGIARVAADAGAAAPGRHVHRRHVESLYVLEGELHVSAGDRELHAEAGTWVQVAPGVPHSVSASGSGRARFLDVHTPSLGFGAFVRALGAGAEEAAAATEAAFDQEPAA